jgi:hypothetical protein
VICAVVSVSYNCLAGGLPRESGVLATSIAFVLGWISLVGWSRFCNERLERSLRVERAKLGRGAEIVRNYVRLGRDASGRRELTRIIAADYTVYLATQLLPFALSLYLSGVPTDRIWSVVWPVTVASPILSALLGLLITISNRALGVKEPSAECSRRT